MKVLGLDMRIARKQEIKDFLIEINDYDDITYELLTEGHNFFLNDNFLFGYTDHPYIENTVVVYMLNGGRNDGIYVGKKLKLFRAYMDRILKDKKIISYVIPSRKTAHKFNKLLFDYKENITDALGNSYIAYKNYAG